MIKDMILERIEAEISKRRKIVREVMTGIDDGEHRVKLTSQCDGLTVAHEIIRLELPDQDRLDTLIELIQNSMDGKPQPVQIQNFDLYSRVSFAIARAPKRYIVRLLQALHYFKNQLN